MPRLRIVRVGVVAGALAALVAGAGAISAPAGSAKASVAKVKVGLKEFKVLPAPTQAKAGLVVFTVQNVGKLDHSFVVIKTNRAPNALPVKGATASEAGKVGKIEPFKPGQTRTLTLNLKPGKYVLLCNVPGHYKAGQFAGFQVR